MPAMSQPRTNGGEPQVVEVSSEAPDRDAAVAAVVAKVRQQAEAFVFLSGGASRMDPVQQRQLLAMFHALALLAQEGRRFAVGDGGTRAGIMEAAGLARRASGRAFALIGVAPATEIPPQGGTPIDPNHSHIVAVRNPKAPATEAWGSETDTMYWLFARLAENRPSVAVVANGGAITLQEVAANVRAGRQMILVEGSGRAADALVSLIQDTQPADREVAELRDRAEQAQLARRSELFRIVSLRSGAAGLRTAIADAFDGRSSREH
jgi:hypothetical protein